MSDGQVFAVGCVVTLLCVAFIVGTVFELRRLGARADKKSGEWNEFQ